MKNLKDLFKLVAVAELVTLLTSLASVLIGTGGLDSIAPGIFIGMIAFTPIVGVSVLALLFLRGIKSRPIKFTVTTLLGWVIGVPMGIMLYIIPLIAVPIIALYFTLYINEEST